MFNLDDYETVEERLVKFWKDHPDGRINTQLIEATGTRFIVRTEVYKKADDAAPWGTGLAFEVVSDRGVNSTSALENCETSSLGRALACIGYATKGKRPSREEMSKVASHAKAQDAIAQVKAKMSQSSGEYVPVPNAEDPWTVVPTKQGQTLGEAVALITETGFGTLTPPPMMQCKHKVDMVWKTGETKTGQPWGHYKCSGVPSRKCMDPIWFNLKNGQWVKQ